MQAWLKATMGCVLAAAVAADAVMEHVYEIATGCAVRCQLCLPPASPWTELAACKTLGNAAFAAPVSSTTPGRRDAMPGAVRGQIVRRPLARLCLRRLKNPPLAVHRWTAQVTRAAHRSLTGQGARRRRRGAPLCIKPHKHTRWPPWSSRRARSTRPSTAASSMS